MAPEPMQSSSSKRSNQPKALSRSGTGGLDGLSEFMDALEDTRSFLSKVTHAFFDSNFPDGFAKHDKLTFVHRSSSRAAIVILTARVGSSFPADFADPAGEHSGG
jgi:hypothetical protein